MAPFDQHGTRIKVGDHVKSVHGTTIGTVIEILLPEHVEVSFFDGETSQVGWSNGYEIVE
jgi:hypothetical protein